jgi:tungstate transport system substrate-binding protein
MRAILSAFFLFFIIPLTVISGTAAPAPAGKVIARGGAASILMETGFLDYLEACFEADTGKAVDWVAADAAHPVRLGKACEVDLLLIDAPGEEMRFMEDGYGTARRLVMYSDYVLVGPPRDPAALAGKNILTALSAIASREVPFVSSEGDSAAYQKELFLWSKAGVEVPAERSWYCRSGKGKVDALEDAAQRGAYTIADRGAFLIHGERAGGSPSGGGSPLTVLIEGERVLRNQYSVIAVDPERCRFSKSRSSKSENGTGSNNGDALVFIEWVLSERGQKAIAVFTLMGAQLFTPNSGEEFCRECR